MKISDKEYTYSELKELLSSNGIEYREIDLRDDPVEEMKHFLMVKAEDVDRLEEIMGRKNIKP